MISFPRLSPPPVSRSGFFSLLALALCAALTVFAAPAASAAEDTPDSAFWIWDAQTPENHSTRYFRKVLHLDAPARNARMIFSCDDIGELYINGRLYTLNRPASLNKPTIRTKHFDLTSFLREGENVIALKVDNHTGPAGLIGLGELRLQNGDFIIVVTDSEWKASDKAAEGWNAPGFDDSTWWPAVEIGSPDMKPWVTMTDTSKFKNEVYISVDEKNLGRLMVDDFSDISSWLGGARRGQHPEHAAPFYFGMGSVPRPERDDGYAGAMEFSFVRPGGEARFGKNRPYQMWVKPLEIGFAANAEGHRGQIGFVFTDTMGREFQTGWVRIEGNDWRDYTLKLDESAFKDYASIRFPIRLRGLSLQIDEPARGQMLIDDIYYVADVSATDRQIAIRPEYSGLDQAPGKPVRLTYMLRNAKAQPVDVSLHLRLFDIDNKPVRSATQKVRIDGYGMSKVDFEVEGFDKYGPYRIELKANNGSVDTTYFGWLAVFEPNNGRVNRVPMWFGIEDQEINTYRYEAELHAQWMKTLGVDINRSGFMGTRFEGIRGATAGHDGVKEMWRPYLENDMIMLIDYASGIPGWVFARGENPRAMPEDYTLLTEHITNVAKAMAEFPQIQYFEWLNEPDLGGFGGTTDQYIESLRVLAPIIREHAPQVKVTTGGMVVGAHPSAKKDFTRRVYQEADYDIVAFHAHDDYKTYKKYQEAIDEWLRLSPGGARVRPIGNTESGFRSYYGNAVDGGSNFLKQAITLVQKITYARSRDSEFYIWFMIQDYWDKYIDGDDSFGLVTTDNQAKPSFIAYNELIRQLANTVPAEVPEHDKRLDLYAFRDGDEMVYVGWPVNPGDAFWLSVSVKETPSVFDMWGNSLPVSPMGKMYQIQVQGKPLYIRSPLNAQLSFGAALIRPIGNTVFAPGSSVRLDVSVANPYARAVQAEMRTQNEVVRSRIGAEAERTMALKLAVPQDAQPGRHTLDTSFTLLDTRTDQPLYESDVPLPYSVAYPVSHSGGSAQTITLDRVGDIRELAYDQQTPRWSGPEDLSATFSMTWDERYLYATFDVKDSDHSIIQDGAMLWQNDSVQFAVCSADNRHTEVTISDTKDGEGLVWCHISDRPEWVGKLNVPFQIERVEGGVRYRFALPFQMLGITPRSGEIFRLAWLVNDNDGNRRMRIRVLEWNGGIDGTKDTNLFGWAILE